MMEDKFRVELLRVIAEFHDFCSVHSLRYYLIGGSLIGAVRHKGFIPWDDDVDVAMPREDYQKLIELASKVGAGYELGIPGDGSCVYPFVKFYSKKFIVAEPFKRKAHIGVWVDVFPLDATFSSKTLRWLHFRLAFLIEVVYMCSSGSYAASKGAKGIVKDILHATFAVVPRHFILKLLNRVMRIKGAANSKIFGNLLGRWREREFIEVGYLEKSSELQFEDIKLWSFSSPDVWLKRVYGDYMSLPPGHEQLRPHPISMEERESEENNEVANEFCDEQ